MVNSHVGHNSLIGNQVIVANGALIGGHVQVDDGVFISGNCLVHQFVRIGSLALMQGGAAVSQDLPPFTLATGDNGICGLNVIGIRRAGFDQKERLKLKRLYRELFLQGKSPIRVAETIQKSSLFWSLNGVFVRIYRGKEDKKTLFPRGKRVENILKPFQVIRTSKSSSRPRKPSRRCLHRRVHQHRQRHLRQLNPNEFPPG